jgi:solute carrier family 25 iron transporter 28/37
LSQHTLVYPLDTVRTHIQVCASCLGRNNNTSVLPQSKDASLLRSALQSKTTVPQTLPTGVFQTIRYLVSQPVLELSAAEVTAQGTTQQYTQGWSRLWRGVQTMFIGCIPAHALYFSSYELVKGLNMSEDGEVSAVGSSMAGAAATFSHDCIMTPLDTIKQRMQLGHYNGSVRAAVQQIAATEGWFALYRSFPVTLVTNIPYGMIMVSTNEMVKQAWTEAGTASSLQTVLAASSAGGCLAAALTTPLDRIKTMLQTQQLTPICARTASVCPRVAVVQHASWYDAARTIVQTEGFAGFFRGLTPRVLSHTPAVAISWTTYETLKQYLLRQYGY